MAKQFEIRNSTAEFLTFVVEGKEDGVQVVYKDDTVWATQKAMATLFDVGVPAISKHLKNIFESGELDKTTTISKMETVVNRGFRGESPKRLSSIILMPLSLVAKEYAETEFEKYRVI